MWWSVMNLKVTCSILTSFFLLIFFLKECWKIWLVEAPVICKARHRYTDVLAPHTWVPDLLCCRNEDTQSLHEFCFK